jgi:hypothetical protein
VLVKNTIDADLKDMPLENMDEGTYEIHFVVADREGDSDYADSDTITITNDDFKKKL